MFKQIILATLITTTIGLSSTAAAENRQRPHRFTEYGNVIDVQPIFKEVKVQTPRKECWVEEERYVTNEGSSQHFQESARPSSQSHRNSGGDTIVGGIIGGVIGNQLGRNSNRGVRNGATVAGAIIGSVIANESRGNNNSNKHRRQPSQVEQVRQPQRVYSTRPVEHCKETTHTEYKKEVQGYNVTYSYRGQTFTTRSNRDPGRRIELQVSVAPARS